MSTVDQFPFATDVAERRIVLGDVGWDTYKRLSADLESSPSIRLSYLDGSLEIVQVEAGHEIVCDILDEVVRVAAEASFLDSANAGCVTMELPHLEMAVQADSVYYLGENAARAKAQSRLDVASLTPDLVVEVEPFGFGAETRPLYSRIEVPEVWSFRQELSIYVLIGGRYHASARSAIFPWLVPDDVTQYVLELCGGETPAVQVREAFRARAIRAAAVSPRRTQRGG